MCQNRTTNPRAQQLIFTGLLLNVVNITLLMPLERQEHASNLNHIAPIMMTAVTIIVLLFSLQNQRQK